MVADGRFGNLVLKFSRHRSLWIMTLRHSNTLICFQAILFSIAPVLVEAFATIRVSLTACQDLSLPDNGFDLVLDKSLIDTFACADVLVLETAREMWMLWCSVFGAACCSCHFLCLLQQGDSPEMHCTVATRSHVKSNLIWVKLIGRS